MKRLVGSGFVVLTALVSGSVAWQGAHAQEQKADTVLFLVLPNRLIGNPHLALKDGKYTQIETIAAPGDALDASAISLKGITLATGKYPAQQCKVSGKNDKGIVLQIYFARQIPPKTILSNIQYKGEAVASYELGFGGGKNLPVYVFQASVAK
jgi:hypothetical protein